MQEGLIEAYESHKLKYHENNYPRHDLELTTIVHALKMWKHYLLGIPFCLKTYHHNLQYLFTHPMLNAR